jgi:hypothetical protein
MGEAGKNGERRLAVEEIVGVEVRNIGAALAVGRNVSGSSEISRSILLIMSPRRVPDTRPYCLSPFRNHDAAVYPALVHVGTSAMLLRD